MHQPSGSLLGQESDLLIWSQHSVNMRTNPPPPMPRCALDTSFTTEVLCGLRDALSIAVDETLGSTINVMSLCLEEGTSELTTRFRGIV